MAGILAEPRCNLHMVLGITLIAMNRHLLLALFAAAVVGSLFARSGTMRAPE
jgi:hypothetical protein